MEQNIFALNSILFNIKTIAISESFLVLLIMLATPTQFFFKIKPGLINQGINFRNALQRGILKKVNSLLAITFIFITMEKNKNNLSVVVGFKDAINKLKGLNIYHFKIK